MAVHLWYLLPPTASISQALAMYESAFQVGQRAWVKEILLRTCTETSVSS